MKLITQRMRIRNVAEKWRSTYSSYLSTEYSGKAFGIDHKLIMERLDKLDLEVATADEVNLIIGNKSWISLKCDECGKECETVMQLGEEPDIESSTVTICAECLHKAWIATMNEN